ncbi:hypothetical protein OC846_004446 [Tilletia horrida]|uniref:Uncharacterized protein n=1 Tax=Tilletia horrida TaxID=155126 RepID=A0AAN6GN98_9BASI|nr:hypothetical protein OC845_006245 [Tilletia horrida]KAK0548497.1 hypothetical protein OC846_004446 [Tilletia horrida]KAK0565373.1 hypothetical protein OC861_003785 [Tilletia horrida]
MAPKKRNALTSSDGPAISKRPKTALDALVSERFSSAELAFSLLRKTMADPSSTMEILNANGMEHTLKNCSDRTSAVLHELTALHFAAEHSSEAELIGKCHASFTHYKWAPKVDDPVASFRAIAEAICITCLNPTAIRETPQIRQLHLLTMDDHGIDGS